MLPISVDKFEVKSSFPKYNYPLYSLVIVNEDGRNVIGKIIKYTRQGTGIVVRSSTGKEHILPPESIVYYEDTKAPEVSLRYVESETYKLLNHYKKNPAILNDEDYYFVDADYTVRFETEQIDTSGMGRSAIACVSGLDLIYLIPFLQHSNKKQIDDVIKHEVAHALTPGEGHSAVWRDVCLTIGGTGQATIKAPEESYTKIPRTWVDPTNSVPEGLWADLGELFDVYTNHFSMPNLAHNLNYKFKFNVTENLEQFMDLEHAADSKMTQNKKLINFIDFYLEQLIAILTQCYNKFTARDVYNVFRIDKEDLKDNLELVKEIKVDFDREFKEYK